LRTIQIALTIWA